MRISKFFPAIISLIAILTSISSLQAKSFPDSECTECHNEKGFSVPLGEYGELGKQKLYTDYDFFKGSVHGQLQCTDCHNDIEKVPIVRTAWVL